MFNIKKIIFIGFFLVKFSLIFANDEEVVNKDLKETVKENLAILEGELDPREWGIRSGCINKNRIRSIRFIDDQHAILKLSLIHI